MVPRVIQSLSAELIRQVLDLLEYSQTYDYLLDLVGDKHRNVQREFLYLHPSSWC